MAAAGIHCETEATMPTYLTDLRCTEHIENIPTDTYFPETPSPDQTQGCRKAAVDLVEQGQFLHISGVGNLEVPAIDHGQGPPVHALRDSTIIKDSRVLKNLLRMEDNFLPGRKIEEVEKNFSNWPRSHGGFSSMRFSSLNKINKNNIGKLKLAWQFNSNDGKKGIQANPVVYDGLVYIPTAVSYTHLTLPTNREV